MNVFVAAGAERIQFLTTFHPIGKVLRQCEAIPPMAVTGRARKGNSMNRKLICLAIAAALCCAGTLTLAAAQSAATVKTIEGKGRPILLARVVVTATPL